MLRNVGPDDWREWKAVRLQALLDAPDAFGSTYAEWVDADELRWRARLIEVHFNVIARVGGIDVGQVSGTSVVDGEAELISMWADPGVRGSGVALELVESVVNYALGAGAVTLRLSVREHNVRAIRLYERAGFVFAERPDEGPCELSMYRQL